MCKSAWKCASLPKRWLRVHKCARSYTFVRACAKRCKAVLQCANVCNSVCGPCNHWWMRLHWYRPQQTNTLFNEILFKSSIFNQHAVPQFFRFFLLSKTKFGSHSSLVLSPAGAIILQQYSADWWCIEWWWRETGRALGRSDSNALPPPPPPRAFHISPCLCNITLLKCNLCHSHRWLATPLVFHSPHCSALILMHCYRHLLLPEHCIENYKVVTVPLQFYLKYNFWTYSLYSWVTTLKRGPLGLLIGDTTCISLAHWF